MGRFLAATAQGCADGIMRANDARDKKSGKSGTFGGLPHLRRNGLPHRSEG
jgi:hypothetical protein